ncbi:YciI family protein [Xylanimonas ulmi]|uniref:YCII-related domain-containing protein n=1 Tax=Xylanimonas ulmi TaxID=228973 RepID=A0A4Q7LZY7_9MICO|nr:YciI family protein [Xylanibacterium ulmi]RZS60604.1 hypothetical protein EV386_0873 [Xylanibacterium ulmi]
MAVFAVTYEYAHDPERLDASRPAHRAFLGALHEAGRVIVSGPLPADDAAPAGALILLDAPDPTSARALLDDDPFRREGLVAQRTVREWVPVIGSLAR